jgi:MYXO-CTERM domain-containing protein
LLVADAAGNQTNPAVTSDGTDYLLAWQDGRAAVSNVFLRRISAQGVVENEVMAPTVTPLGGQSVPSAASNGSGYLVAWVSGGNVLATRVTAAGAKQGSNLVISQAQDVQSNPTVASNGTDYLVAWQDSRGPSVDVYAARVTSTGTIVDGAGLALSTAGNAQSFPSAASNGTEYLVVWQDLRSFSTNDIYFRRVPVTGNSFTGEALVSNAAGHQLRPSVTSNGSDFLIVWQDERAGNKDIYGATLSFTPTTVLTEFAIDTSTEHASIPSVVHRNGEYLVSYEERENYIPRVHSRLLTGCSGDASDDADGDGVCDGADNCETVSNADQANADGDDAGDACDECDADPGKSLAGACGCGTPDTDTDSDGTANCDDGCPSDPGKLMAGVCGCGVADTDSDGDGTPNCNDGCPNDPSKLVAGACGCGVADTDSDTDGTPDCQDACPSDPLKVTAGQCGCGVSEADADGDGTPNCNDACPSDPGKVTAGSCGCGVSDTDVDGDGAVCDDGCSTDPLKVAPGACGCGVSDTDVDGDGAVCDDACSSDPGKVSPGICGCSASDDDQDGDGTVDCQDSCPLDPNDACQPVNAGGAGGEGGGLGVSGEQPNGTGGRSGSGGDTSTGGRLAQAGSGVDEGGDATGSGNAADRSGCGCRTPRAADGPVAPILLALILGIGARRRRGSAPRRGPVGARARESGGSVTRRLGDKSWLAGAWLAR